MLQSIPKFWLLKLCYISYGSGISKAYQNAWGSGPISRLHSRYRWGLWSPQRSASKLIYIVGDRLPVLTGFQQETSTLPCGPLHWAAHSRLLASPRASSLGISLCNIILEAALNDFCHSLFIRTESRAAIHSQGRGPHKGMNNRRWDHKGSSQRLQPDLLSQELCSGAHTSVIMKPPTPTAH